VTVPTCTGGTLERRQGRWVTIWPTLTANKILEACIDALWGSGVEQKMLNDYNAAKLGILDSSYIESYKVFLNDRKSLKERVDGDFLDWENG
jgi:hypothetical protein